MQDLCLLCYIVPHHLRFAHELLDYWEIHTYCTLMIAHGFKFIPFSSACKKATKSKFIFPSFSVNSGKLYGTIFVNLNTPNSKMKKKNFALGRHSITPLGQLYRRSQIHEPKAIKLQQIQFYICRITHIWYTHEETTLHCPEEKKNYSILKIT